MKSGPIDQLEYLVDITDFEKGIYILKVSTINGQFISKIVKQWGRIFNGVKYLMDLNIKTKKYNLLHTQLKIYYI